MEQHVLIDFELDPEVVDELASGRTGGWLGRRRPPQRHAAGWRTFVRPIWPIVLLVGLLAAGARGLSQFPAAIWAPVVFDLLRLAAIAVPVAAALAFLIRRLVRRRLARHR